MQSHIATLILSAMITVRADAHDGVPQPDPGDAGDCQRGRQRVVGQNQRYVMRITGGDAEGQAELGNFPARASGYWGATAVPAVKVGGGL